MRHKVLVLFFLWGVFRLGASAKDTAMKIAPDSSSDSILLGKPEERKASMKKLFESVPVDTAAKKVVSLEPHFNQKYLEDKDFNYNQEEGGKSFFERLFEKLGRILDKLFGTSKPGKYPGLMTLLFKIFCGLVILAAIYFIIRLMMNHKGKWFFTKKSEPIIIDIHNTEQLIQSADFEQLISDMEKQGDTRQSIRLYYLWLLKELKENELIVWLPEKTNADYQSELKEESVREIFRYLSYLYNYIWYGEFSIGDEDYMTAKKAFVNYLKGDRRHG